jgi:hypothetical protein
VSGASGAPSSSSTLGTAWTRGQALGRPARLDCSLVGFGSDVLVLLTGIRDIGPKCIDVVLEPCDSGPL